MKNIDDNINNSIFKSVWTNSYNQIKINIVRNSWDIVYNSVRSNDHINVYWNIKWRIASNIDNDLFTAPISPQIKCIIVQQVKVQAK